MRCVVVELAGMGTYVPPPPPPGRAKVAQTPGRARVKGSVSTDIGNMETELWA